MENSGLFYKKIDLHVHTPASHDFNNKEITAKQIVEYCVSIGLDAIAITDHNTGEFIDKIKEEATGKITIFPGVEISCVGGQNGIHIIGIFGTDKNRADIESLLARLEIDPSQYGKQETITSKSVNDVINLIAQMNGIPILAHCQSNKGVLHDMNGQQRIEVMNNKNLLGAEVSLSDFMDKEKASRKKRTIDLLDGTDANYRRKIAVYTASDSHAEGKEGHYLEGIGSQFTYFKTDTVITLESLRQCFIDSDVRIRQSYENIKYDFPYIKEIYMNSGFFKDETIILHEGLNSIIGPKGAGKSLLIEIMRFVFNQPPKDIDIKKDHIEKLNSKLEQYSEVKAKYIDKFGNENEITRKYKGDDSYDDKIEFPILFLSQNEIIKTAESEKKQIEFIDKFFDFTEYKTKIIVLKNELKKLNFQYAECISAYISNKILKASIDSINKEIEKIEKELKDPEYYIYKQKEKAQQMARLQENDFDRILAINENLKITLDNLNLNLIDSEILESNPELNRNNSRLEAAKRMLLSTFVELEIKLHKGKEDFDKDKAEINNSYITSRTQYEEKLKSKEINFNIENTRKEKLNQVSGLIDKQQELKTQIDMIKSIREQRESKLGELEEVYNLYSKKRKQVCKNFEDMSNGRLRINLYEASNRDLFKEKLKQIKRGSYIREDEIEKISEKMTPNEFVNEIIRYNVSDNEGRVTKISSLSSQTMITSDTIRTLFDFILQEMKIEDILEMGYAYRAEDIPEIKLRVAEEQYEDINKVSIGQKCTAMLIIALSQGDMPIVIDQPEDSLDLKTIWEDMCNKIRENKEKRQFIFTTHNSSLAVASDTDKYIVINSNATKGRIIDSGAIETEEVKKQVINYLEGTELTYEKKYNKYGFKY